MHAGFIDTDMIADLDVPKASPGEVSRLIIDGLEAGAAEVLTDEATVKTKAALSGPVELLTFDQSH